MKFKCSENLKSSPIYFVVQRTTPFTDYDVPITFGVCINTTTGFFIAPKCGTYFFSWREEHGDRSRLTFHSSNNLQINDVVSMQIYLPVDKWGCPVNANERAEFHPISPNLWVGCCKKFSVIRNGLVANDFFPF
jgi:hypothetical protein